MTIDNNEKRRHSRSAYNALLEFSGKEEPEGAHQSTSIDISESGIGLVTDCALEPGQVIIFKSRENPAVLRIAIVQWSMKSGGKYRAGLMFI